MRLVSFDVWDTLLVHDVLLRTVARELNDCAHIDQESAFIRLRETYDRARDLRRSGEIGCDIVTEATRMAADMLGIGGEACREAIARAFSDVDLRQLVRDGAELVLQDAKELGITVVTLGNVMFWPGRYNRALLTRTNLGRYIDEQLYADEIGLQKPQREAFDFVLKRFSVEPREAMHVGDGIHEDFAGAIISGWMAVAIVPELSHAVRLSESAFAIPSILDLREIFRDVHNDGNDVGSRIGINVNR
jgi:putative hydrolase of the HAD superfamily